MSDEPGGGGPLPRDAAGLLRQLRRAMREQADAGVAEDQAALTADTAAGPPRPAPAPASVESAPSQPEAAPPDLASEPSSTAAVPEPAPDPARRLFPLRTAVVEPPRGDSLFDTPGAGILAVPPEVGTPPTRAAAAQPLTAGGAATPSADEPPVVPSDEEPPRRASGRGRRRSVLAILSLVVLVAAIPALTWYGVHLVLQSRGGQAVSSIDDPHAPGYLALVTPTPTALVIQVNAQNQAVSLTLLALTQQDKGGGTVIFIPLDTAVPVPAFGIDRLRTAYGRGGATALASAASQVLGIGFSEVVTVDPGKLAALVTPVAPITVDNPDAVNGAQGTFAAGNIQLTASQVAPFLVDANTSETDLARLNRQSQFWAGWLAAVAANHSRSGVVPGESSTGIGRFVRVLAQGSVTYETLPVSADPTPLSGGGQLFHADEASVGRLVALGVPYPVGSGTQRTTVRLLNGVNGKAIPQGIVQSVVLGGGQISEIGNAGRFGVTTTEIHYTDPADKAAADKLDFVLGGKVKEVLDATGEDTVKVTVVLGSDLIDHPPQPLAFGSTSGG